MWAQHRGVNSKGRATFPCFFITIPETLWSHDHKCLALRDRCSLCSIHLKHGPLKTAVAYWHGQMLWKHIAFKVFKRSSLSSRVRIGHSMVFLMVIGMNMAEANFRNSWRKELSHKLGGLSLISYRLPVWSKCWQPQENYVWASKMWFLRVHGPGLLYGRDIRKFSVRKHSNWITIKFKMGLILKKF